MKTIVLGADGLLGRHIVQIIPDAVGLSRRAGDVTDLDALIGACEGATLLINCAAYTDVDGAEAHEAEAYRVNALGAQNAAQVALRLGCRLIHVSTDFVFDGSLERPYDEFDQPNPLSVYGRSKWAGEELVQRSGARALIVRVQALYGVGGRNFASKMADLLRDGRSLTLDRERRVQPTTARAAAHQIAVLAQAGVTGIFHVSCHGETTWAGFARHLAGALGLAPSWREVPTAELRQAAVRPANCAFRHRLLELYGLDQVPPWEEALAAFLDENSRRRSP